MGLVVGLDLFWSLAVGSTGPITYGLIDEPAHLATCVIVLLAAAALADGLLSRRFVVAALVASVAIDIDHLPGYLGSHLLTGGLARPYTHSLLLVVVPLAFGWASSRPKARQIWFGIALGVSAHLLRDLATGPGVPLLWPASDAVITLPYVVFATSLGLAVMLAMRDARARQPWRPSRVELIASVMGVILVFGLAASASASAAPKVSMGAYIPGSSEDPSLIDAYGAEVGSQPVIVSSYKDWTVPLIDTSQLDAAWSRGAVPCVTWEPWSQHDDGVVFSLRAIANGGYDAYLTEAARAAAAWGNPILLRFAHEMNGGWYPWGRGRNGNTPADYVAAWRHVVGIFRANGATNVKWVWTPYVTSDGHLPFRRFFPGNKWVDWVGLDGLNGGKVFGWRSFSKIFDASYRQLVRMTPRPLILAEVASTEEGGHKAAWLSRALRRVVPRLSHIRAIVWWADDGDYRGNFGVDSSASALSALRAAMALPRYESNRDLLLATPERLRTPPRRHRRLG